MTFGFGDSRSVLAQSCTIVLVRERGEGWRCKNTIGHQERIGGFRTRSEEVSSRMKASMFMELMRRKE